VAGGEEAASIASSREGELRSELAAQAGKTLQHVATTGTRW
jgi:hypothetical protein